MILSFFHMLSTLCMVCYRLIVLAIIVGHREVVTILRSDPRPTAFWLSAICAGLGALLWLPFDTFGSSRTFRVMAGYASEQTWGMLLVAIAVYKLCALLFLSRSRMARCFVALPGMFIWACWSYLFFVASPTSTAMAVYPSLALLWVWVHVRLIQD